MPRRSTCPPERLLPALLLAWLASACAQPPAPPREAPSEPEAPELLDPTVLLAAMTTPPPPCMVRVESRIGPNHASSQSPEPLRLDLDAATAEIARYRLAIGELEAWIDLHGATWSVRSGGALAALHAAPAPPNSPAGARCATARIETAAPDTPPSDAVRAVLASWSAAVTQELTFCEHSGLTRWSLEQRIGDHGTRSVLAECSPSTTP